MMRFIPHRRDALLSASSEVPTASWSALLLGINSPSSSSSASIAGFSCAHVLGWLDPSAQWMQRWLLAAHSRDFFFAAAARTDLPRLLALACAALPVDALAWTESDSDRQSDEAAAAAAASGASDGEEGDEDEDETEHVVGAQTQLLHCEFLWSLVWALLRYRRGRRLLEAPAAPAHGRGRADGADALGSLGLDPFDRLDEIEAPAEQRPPPQCAFGLH
jgi:hypothetical protein